MFNVVGQLVACACTSKSQYWKLVFIRCRLKEKAGGANKSRRTKKWELYKYQARKAENNQTLAGMMKSLEDECKNCAPTTPLECISRCQVYKLKNELRNLRETMNNPDYMKELFNVLKNETRFYVLETIVNDKCSVAQLQRVLKKTGYNYQYARLPRRIFTAFNQSWFSYGSERRIRHNDVWRSIS